MPFNCGDKALINNVFEFKKIQFSEDTDGIYKEKLQITIQYNTKRKLGILQTVT